MPRRTVLEARKWFDEDYARNLPDALRREYEGLLTRIEAQAVEMAAEHVSSSEAYVLGIRDAALRELTAVRDECDSLRSEASLGRVTAVDYADRLRELSARQEHAERRLAEASDAVEQLAEVEEDPIAWFDDLARRHPHLQTEVPW